MKTRRNRARGARGWHFTPYDNEALAATPKAGLGPRRPLRALAEAILLTNPVGIHPTDRPAQ